MQLISADLSGELEDKTLLRGADGDGFAEDLRIGIYLSNTPDSTIKTHMLMRTELVRWAGFRQEG